jgi:hypothetical protein
MSDIELFMVKLNALLNQTPEEILTKRLIFGEFTVLIWRTTEEDKGR